MQKFFVYMSLMGLLTLDAHSVDFTKTTDKTVTFSLSTSTQLGRPIHLITLNTEKEKQVDIESILKNIRQDLAPGSEAKLRFLAQDANMRNYPCGGLIVLQKNAKDNFLKNINEEKIEVSKMNDTLTCRTKGG